LLWDNIKLLDKAKNNGTLPKYIMIENVKNLVGNAFINDFNNLIEVLDELGFNTYWKVINGKDCGVPQNRERVFVIAIRKDIDTSEFTFPKPFDNGMRLRDILEDAVDEKYYLPDLKIGDIDTPDNSYCIDANYHKGTNVKQYLLKHRRQLVFENRNSNDINMLGLLNIRGNEQVRRVYGEDGISPTLNTMQGGNRQPKNF